MDNKTKEFVKENAVDEGFLPDSKRSYWWKERIKTVENLILRNSKFTVKGKYYG